MPQFDCECSSRKCKKRTDTLCATLCDNPYYIHKTEKLNPCTYGNSQVITLQRAYCDCLIPKPDDFFDPYSAPCSPEFYTHKFASLRRKWSQEFSQCCFSSNITTNCDPCNSCGITKPCYTECTQISYLPPCTCNSFIPRKKPCETKSCDKIYCEDTCKNPNGHCSYCVFSTICDMYPAQYYSRPECYKKKSLTRIIDKICSPIHKAVSKIEKYL